MAKDPAFLFYPGDWLGGTLGMSFEEKGAYMELLMMQFNRGHMTSHMIGQTVGQLWVKLEDKFQKDANGLYFNARLDAEKIKRKGFVDSRNNNISGKNQYTKNRGHMTSHMENENEDVNKDNKRVKGVKGEKGKNIFIPPTIDQVVEFFKDKGYTEQSAIKAFNHYDLADWKDTYGKQVLNWKQKMNTNWLKDENKVIVNQQHKMVY